VTNPGLFGRRPVGSPTLPRGDVLGTYDTYAEAQGIIDRLARAEFDVKSLAIVGNDLKTVERVTGRLNYGRAAMRGAASGGWFGLFLGFALFIFTPDATLPFLVAAVLFGAGFGMLAGIVSYAFTRRHHDFTSTHQLMATNYQVLINPALTASAQQALAKAPAES
jgi:hypothetical protein